MSYNPNYCIHPGCYLEEILRARKINKKFFAHKIGISVKQMKRILCCKVLYDVEFAIKIGNELEMSSELWVNFVKNYNTYIDKKSKIVKL